MVAIRDRAVSSGTTVGTFTLPAHQTGDLLILVQTAHRGGSATPSGWTLVHDVMAGTGTVSRALKVWAKIAASNAETVTVASSGFRASAVGLSIRDHAVTTLTDIVIASTLADTLNDVDYATLSGLSAGAEYAVLAGFGGRGGTGYFPTVAPSGFFNYTGAGTGTGSTDTTTVVSDRILSGATTVDPPSQSVTASNHVDWTLAIPGAASSAVVPAAGTVLALTSAVGAITRQTSVSGAVVSVSAASGAVTVQSGATLSGTVAVFSNTSGSITKSTNVSGTVSVVSTVTGAPGSAPLAISGTVSITSTATATARVRGRVSGRVSIFSTVVGALKMIEAPQLPPTVLMRPFATATAGGLTLDVVDGDLTLDSSKAPYAVARLEAAMTDPDDAEALDPRDGVRVIVNAGDTAAGTSRTFNLGVRNRTVDHAAKTIALELTSDEATLMDFAPLARDLGAFEQQSSLRGIVNYALNKAAPGASLQAGGAPDQPFLVAADSTNLFPDPRYERTPDNGIAVVNAQTIPDTTWGGTENLAGVHLYNPTSEDAFIQLTNNAALPFGTQVGRSYTFSATGAARSALGGAEQVLRSRRLVAIGRVNGTYTDLARSEAVPLTVNDGTRVSVTFTVPAGCDQILLRAYHGHTQGTITWRAFRLSETHEYPGPHNWQYFDGSRPTDGLYAYSWTGAPNASTSKRVALIDRAPELLAWEPAMSAWDFLSPIVTAAGVKLWCDENRAWRLTDPAEYTVPGVLSLNGNTSTEGSDTIDRSDPESFCTGVVVRYRWRDNSGQQREAIDAAGEPGQILEWEFDRPYPGPGAAAAILSRRAGAGRVQEVVTLSDWTATPGMEARISLPSTTEQQGALVSVKWALTDGLMQVGTRGLVDLVPGSINALTGTIDQLPGTINSL